LLTEGRSASIWDRIRATADTIPGTKIPATFQISLEEGINYVNPTTGTNVLWTNANATKHLGEYVSRLGKNAEKLVENGKIYLESDHKLLNGALRTEGVRSQVMLESYSSALNEAMKKFVKEAPGRHKGEFSGWEFGVDTETGVVFHAFKTKMG